nr:hypothetical protein [Pandoravirus belohorizontensis]
MADASRSRVDVLDMLSAALASLAKPPDDPYEQERETLSTTSEAASAILCRARAKEVCVSDWRGEMLLRSAACDPRGVRLCLATMDALGANVHALSVVSARTKSTAMPGLPRACDTDTTHGWWRADVDEDDDDSGNDHKHEDEDDSHCVDHNSTHGDHSGVGGGTPRSVVADQGPQGIGTQSDGAQGVSPPHLLLSCSRLVGTCCGTDADPPHDDSAVVTKETRRFVFEVRVGFWPDVWMTAGPVIDAETGICIDLGCLLVARDKPIQESCGDGPLVARRRLVDFLASGLHTWADFAAQRYRDLRRLPAVLAAHGWRVDGLADAPWSWTCRAGPLAESDPRSLSLAHPDLPENIYIHLDHGHLVVSADSIWIDGCPLVDAPGALPADPIGSMFYGDGPGPASDPCHCTARQYHSFSHAERDMRAQRARLVGMGLVSEYVLDGRIDAYIARQWDRQVERYLFGVRNTPARVLPLVGLDAMAQLIKAHVAQAIFGEYGPVETATDRRLNSGLCDDLLSEAIESGRLCLGLRYIDKITADAYECPIDCDLGAHSTVPCDRPRMLVNWRVRCAAVHTANGQGRRDTAPRKEMRSVRVWAGVAVQTDGRGGACVALIVRRERAPLDEPVDDPTADGATWGIVAERCARGAPEHPPELHPALVASIETERACDQAACVTPWAYHTGADGPVDARALTEWALARIGDLFKAIDDVAATSAPVGARASPFDK